MAVQVDVVLGVEVFHRGFQEAVAPVQWQADAWLDMDAVAVGAGQALDTRVVPRSGLAVLVDEVAVAQAALEAHELGRVVELQAARIHRQRAIQGELGQAVVRGDVGNGCHFIGVGIEARGVAVAAPGQGAALVDVGVALHVKVGGQVLEVVGVADVGVVHLGQQAGVQAAGVLPAVQPALVLVLRLQLAVVVLVVQVGATDLAFAALGEVAEFAAHHQTALGHVTRVQRRVVVGGEVEVVGRQQGEAGVAATADARREETGLATVVDREVDVGGVEHRYILDPQGDVGRGAETGGRVQLDVVALQVPGVVTRLAAGVGAVLQADDGVVLALGVESAAAYV